jgi:hypothetical protein
MQLCKDIKFFMQKTAKMAVFTWDGAVPTQLSTFTCPPLSSLLSASQLLPVVGKLLL